MSLILDLIVYDFETGGLVAGEHEAIQIAGKAYNGSTFEPYPDGEFCSLMKPLHPERLQQGALDVNKKTIQELMKAPDQGVVWNQFVKWVQRYNKGAKKGQFTAAIACGKNIRSFDSKFLWHLNELHLPKKNDTVIFNRYRDIDLQDFLYTWFGGSDALPNEKMDTLRDYFGMSKENGHDALVDVCQTGELIMRFIKLHRHLFQSASEGKSVRLRDFRGSCSQAA